MCHINFIQDTTQQILSESDEYNRIFAHFSLGHSVTVCNVNTWMPPGLTIEVPKLLTLGHLIELIAIQIHTSNVQAFLRPNETTVSAPIDEQLQFADFQAS